MVAVSSGKVEWCGGLASLVVGIRFLDSADKVSGVDIVVVSAILR